MRQNTHTQNNGKTAFGRVMSDSARDSKLLQAMINASQLSIAVLDEDRTIVFANRSWRQFAARIVRLVGGEFKIISAPSRETTVGINVPIQQEGSLKGDSHFSNT